MAIRNPQRASRSSRSERPFLIWLTAAAVLHAGLVLVLRIERREALPPPRAEFIELSIDAPADEKGAEPERPEPSRAPDTGEVASLRPSPSERGSRPHAPVVPEPEAPGRGLVEPEAREPEAAPGDDIARQSPAPPAASEVPGTPAPPGRLSLGALGLGGENPFLGMPFPSNGDRGGANAPAPERGPKGAESATRAAERRLENYMVAGMLEHDRKAGMARGGVLVTTLREAAIEIASPVNGQAEFVATFDATGLVTSVTAVRASSSPTDWQKVAARALKQIAKKRIRVPPGAAGLEVRVLVSSKVQLASGHSKGVAMDMVNVPVKKGDGANPTRVSLLPTSQSSTRNVPGTAAGATAVPQSLPRASGTTLAELDGDPADIGSSAQRIVHVSITSERAL